MSVSKSIRALLSIRGFKQSDLMNVLKRDNGKQAIASKQALSNKFAGERWSADDLVSIAAFAGCKLAFILPDGERVLIGDSDAAAVPRGEMSGVAGGGVTPLNSRE